MRIPITLATLVLLLMACKSQLNSSATEAKKESEPGELIVETRVNQLPKLDEIPAGHARIIASVTEIYPIEKGAQFPCSDHPCKALIKVEKVVGYGHSFGGPLQAGRQLEVYFPLSMNPSKKVFPNREVLPLPGLEERDMFEANMKSVFGMGNKTTYQINTYEIPEKKK